MIGDNCRQQMMLEKQNSIIDL